MRHDGDVSKSYERAAAGWASQRLGESTFKSDHVSPEQIAKVTFTTIDSGETEPYNVAGAIVTLVNGLKLELAFYEIDLAELLAQLIPLVDTNTSDVLNR